MCRKNICYSYQLIQLLCIRAIQGQDRTRNTRGKTRQYCDYKLQTKKRQESQPKVNVDIIHTFCDEQNVNLALVVL